METSDKNRSQAFQEWTAGWFNIAKLVALVVAALWTFYQWNISIFPKESYENFARTAARRTDLNTAFLDPNVGYIEEYDTPQPELSLYPPQEVKKEREEVKKEWETRLVIVSGTCRFKNTKDFPISLNVRSLLTKLGRRRQNESVDDSRKATARVITWDWLYEKKIGLHEAFGPMVDGKPVIVEPRGEVLLPLYVALEVIWEPDEQYRFIELDLQVSLLAVHPETGDLIEGTEKQKHLTYRGIIHRNGGSKLQFGGMSDAGHPQRYARFNGIQSNTRSSLLIRVKCTQGHKNIRGKLTLPPTG